MTKNRILQAVLIFTTLYLIYKLDIDLPLSLFLGGLLIFANRKRLRGLKINAKHVMPLSFFMLCAYCVVHSYYLLVPGLALACVAVTAAYRKRLAA